MFCLCVSSPLGASCSECLGRLCLFLPLPCGLPSCVVALFILCLGHFVPAHSFVSFSVSFFPPFCWSCFFCVSPRPVLLPMLTASLAIVCWVPCRCSPHHAWPDCLCQCFHPLVESQIRAAQHVLHVLNVSCACFLRCCTFGAERPFSDRRGSVFLPTPLLASPACGHGSRGLCVELQLVFAWLLSESISLKPSVTSEIIRSRAFCDVAQYHNVVRICQALDIPFLQSEAEFCSVLLALLVGPPLLLSNFLGLVTSWSH